MKNNKKVGIAGGNVIKDKDRWVDIVAKALKRWKATEVVMSASSGDHVVIAEKAASISDVPNVILPGPVAMEERASMLIVLPGQAAKTNAIAKLFRDHNKRVINMVEVGE